MTGVRDYSIGEPKHNVVALARTAKSLKLPIVVTTAARDSRWGPTFPELGEVLPDILREVCAAFPAITKDNARPETGTVYGTMDMDWAGLMGQIAQANGK